MQQAVITAPKGLSDEAFVETMITLGGKKRSNSEFTFVKENDFFTVFLDDSDDGRYIVVECPSGTSIEFMRPFLAAVLSETKGTVEIDDVGVFDFDDLENNRL